MKEVAKRSSGVRKKEQGRQIYLNRRSKDSEERKNYLRELWGAIIRESREIPSGAGFMICGECGLVRRKKKAKRRTIRFPKQNRHMEEIHVNPGSEDPKVKENSLRELWRFIIRQPSGSGFRLYGESGLVSRRRKAEVVWPTLFDLKAENGKA